ncbi:MAG: DUF493 domain-containing protein [Pseudomonadota bacterium]
MSTDNEELIDFPTAFPVKIMGRNTEQFVSHAEALVLRHTDGDPALSVSSRPSANERFLSVTVEITATSRAQLDAIYQSLTDDPEVLMAL